MSTTLVTKQRVEEMIRQRLGIADLSDPKRVAAALSRRYPELEAKFDAVDAGFLMGTYPVASAGGSSGPTLAGRELERARRRLEEDLDAVIGTAELREAKDAYAGWKEDILRDFDEAQAVAGEVTLGSAWLTISGVSRKLLDYAAVARAGAPASREGFWPLWRLADTVDVARWAILARVGEAAYEAGQGNTELPFTPAREALATAGRQVLNALRSLLGLVPDNLPDAAEISALSRIRAAVVPSRALYRVEDMERILDAVLTLVTSDDATLRRQLMGIRVVSTVELENIVVHIEQTVADQTVKTLLLAASLRVFLDEVNRISSLGRLVALVVPSVLARSVSVSAEELQARSALQHLIEVRRLCKERVDRFAAEEDVDTGHTRDGITLAVELVRVLDEIALDLVESYTGSNSGGVLTGDFLVAQGARLAFQRRTEATRTAAGLAPAQLTWREQLSDRLRAEGHLRPGATDESDVLRVPNTDTFAPTTAGGPAVDPVENLLLMLALEADGLFGAGGFVRTSPGAWAFGEYQNVNGTANPNPAAPAATAAFPTFLRNH